MINTLVMVGVIERVHISDSKKKDKATAAIMVRYGDDRNQSGGAVEFINAALIRIPPYRLPAFRDRLKEGAFVHIVGHIQGVFKHQAGQGVLDTELVADRIDFVQGLNTVRSAYRRDRGTTSHANRADGAEREGPSGHDTEGADDAGADAILESGAEHGAGSGAGETPETASAA